MKKNSDSTSIEKPAPRVFLSYTHEDSLHKEWLLKLATDLRTYGVDAILDRWECKYGSDIHLFMEQGIRESERVLLVCTPAYQKKEDTGAGGVGYERLVVTAEMAKNIQTEKFICVLRRGDENSAIPTFARSRLFIASLSRWAGVRGRPRNFGAKWPGGSMTTIRLIGSATTSLNAVCL